ncbi:MAG: LysR substrate-binding domain-containing protein, partial [Iodobacter sp.]
KVQLNENGLFILPQAETLISDASHIECAFNKYIPARITIAASSTIGNYVMPDLLSQFMEADPESRIRLNIYNTHQVVEEVVNFRADVGFIEGICNDSRVITEHWREDEMVVYVSSTHPFAQQQPSLAELAAAPWIVREPFSGSREVADAALLPLLGSMNVVLELGSSEAVTKMVLSDAGVACQSRHVVGTQLDAGIIKAIKLPELNLKRHFYMVSHRDKSVTSGLRDFIRMSQHQMAL